ncbi:phosphate-binding protein [Malaciobacter halophilus]|uniref:Phosphate-binding protein n=1 Tax=Malaciobacter halophilus TaxID=197482 RepID=A0A2N1J5M7_9BACT|nr:phosphate ABC transporter substrate-binding protein [Malaciobacter halophilus]AXH09242.1 phosphate ABC transporter, periplasmic phosphate-binding protein [Malaciobacter halophilus]PKI81877.1 phosphate-binding protein [Malaciobacter halophilus]
MKKLLLTIITLSLTLLNASDLKVFENLKGSLNIAGGTAHIKCEKEAIKNIMRKYPDISISIAGGGSGMGIKQVSSKIIDLANSGRKPTKKEIENGNLKLYRFAIDGIGVIVNPKLNIDSLTTKQLQDIFSGKITNFKEIGLHDAVINLYTRDESSATRKVFWKKALKKSPISKKARVVSSNAAMKTAVSKDKNAIGIISLGVANSSVKLLKINGVAPTVENINKDTYKVARGLYLLSNGEPSKLASAYISYLRSKEGAKIVSKYGFIPVNE